MGGVWYGMYVAPGPNGGRLREAIRGTMRIMVDDRCTVLTAGGRSGESHG